MPPLEAWQKVFLGDEGFLATYHAQFGCIACHGGTNGTDDMDAAHEGVVRDPDPEQACGLCHTDVKLVGEERALEYLDEYHSKALKQLDVFGAEAAPLKDFSEYLITRVK